MSSASVDTSIAPDSGVQAPSKYADFVQNTLRLGDTCPDFTAETSKGKLNLYEYLGSSWGILFSHPRDFTPICTTELGRVAVLEPKFAERNCKVLGLSVDTPGNHSKWIGDINEIMQCDVQFPIISDADRRISCLYGMLDQNYLEDTGMPLTVRSVFIIGPDRKLKATLTYPASTGRNFDEILRVVDSLQLAASHKVATPADWVPGKEVVVLGTVSTDDAQKMFPKGVKVVRPWLRTTPDPKNA